MLNGLWVNLGLYFLIKLICANAEDIPGAVQNHPIAQVQGRYHRKVMEYPLEIGQVLYKHCHL